MSAAGARVARWILCLRGRGECELAAGVPAAPPGGAATRVRTVCILVQRELVAKTRQQRQHARAAAGAARNEAFRAAVVVKERRRRVLPRGHDEVAARRERCGT